MTTGAVGGASAIASSRRGALARSSSPETYSTAAPAGVVSSRTSKSLDVVTPVECRRCRSTAAAGTAGLLVTDRIVLAIPTEARFRSVATLVLGGIGSRADLPYERMDDLQLAVLSALEAADQAEVTLEVDADESGVSLALGPVRDGSGDDEGLGLVLVATRRRRDTRAPRRRRVVVAQALARQADGSARA